MARTLKQNEPEPNKVLRTREGAAEQDTEGHVLRTKVLRTREGAAEQDTEGHGLMRGPISSRGE